MILLSWWLLAGRRRRLSSSMRHNSDRYSDRSHLHWRGPRSIIVGYVLAIHGDGSPLAVEWIRSYRVDVRFGRSSSESGQLFAIKVCECDKERGSPICSSGWVCDGTGWIDVVTRRRSTTLVAEEIIRKKLSHKSSGRILGCFTWWSGEWIRGFFGGNFAPLEAWCGDEFLSVYAGSVKQLVLAGMWSSSVKISDHYPEEVRFSVVLLIDETRKENLSIFHVVVREAGVQRVESRTSSYFLWCIFRLLRDFFQDLHRARESERERASFMRFFRSVFFVWRHSGCIAETAKKQDSAPYTYVRFVFMFILCCSVRRPRLRPRRRLISLLLLCITLWFGISVASCASRGDFLRFRGVCYFSTEIINIIAGSEK